MQLNFSYIDIFFGVVLAIAAIRCAVKGFIAEALSMAAVIGGILIAVLLSGQVAKLFDKWFGASSWNQLIAFLALFLLVYLVIKIIENILHDFLHALNIERLDNALGLFLGLVEGVLVIAILLIIMSWLEATLKLNFSALTRKSFFSGMIGPLIQPATAAFRK